jgi:acyl-CoA reductase-like NAD-dependent aldehyde dehydrogenase
VTADVLTARHPFLDGKPKRVLIDGKWVEAASGKTFDTVTPSTGEALAAVAEGDSEDIDRAVEAARRAFNGPWSRFKPYERQTLLLRLADLVERHFEELAALDMGTPISRTRANRTSFGLGSGLRTRDLSKAHRLARGIRAGSVWINCYQAMDPAVPFGGYKMSGYGRGSGKQHVEEYLNVKAVWIKTG